MGAGAWFGRWWRAVIFVVAGAAVVIVMGRDGYLLLGLAIAAGLVGAAVLLGPLRARRSITHADAQQRAHDEGLLVGYWRPGCVHCERLRAALRREPGILWVDIWQDPEAAAFVRELNGGAEAVPMVIAGAAVWPSPGVEKVRAALRASHEPL